jgi:hypothetical protein
MPLGLTIFGVTDLAFLFGLATKKVFIRAFAELFLFYFCKNSHSQNAIFMSLSFHKNLPPKILLADRNHSFLSLLHHIYKGKQRKAISQSDQIAFFWMPAKFKSIHKLSISFQWAIKFSIIQVYEMAQTVVIVQVFDLTKVHPRARCHKQTHKMRRRCFFVYKQ